ncbi:hypothetical protein SS50377_28329 [Spironucleus salmonicida]|uniref:Uncharacterized protein n=1 Tax=Spironucleus salmonicida TaxID=348837 RepID=V6LRR7_9EUKA|nr:hypothetical protein SS50377_28310 [Spironucleus salmonicida]KAH0570351.1 hypothetical protein SS50377_28329 [Spironucleus salmonicida]|eukprot:EST45541.1 Hypothetical protein SS50377_14507 [Spironucleus salmonicida]
MEANAIASDLTAEILDILCSGTSESWDLEYCIAYQTAQLALFSEGARTLLQQVRAAHQLEILDTTAPQIQSPRIVSQSTSLLLSDGYDGIQLVTAEGSVKIPDQTWAGCKETSFEIQTSLPQFLAQSILVDSEVHLRTNLTLIKRQEFAYQRLRKFVFQADLYWLKSFFA